MKIRVVRIDPLHEPVITHIDDGLKGFQNAVGGLIETISFTGSSDLVFNEEGKLNGLIPNRGIWPDDNGKFQDIIFGPIICCGVDHVKGTFTSISDEDLELCMKRFAKIEIWLAKLD